MSISEKRVIIAGGAGGPNDDSIPVYGDNKAPRGAWALDLNGKQLMWQNGRELIIVNPELLTPAENEGNKYYTFKVNGEKDYCKVWLIGDDGHGAATQPFWVEYSKLISVVDEPEEPPEPEQISKTYRILALDLVNMVVEVQEIKPQGG